MADSTDNLGDLTVNVTGDLSELQSSLDQAAGIATAAGETIAASFQSIIDASGLAGGDLAVFQSVLEQDATAGIALTQSLQDLADSAASVGDVVAGAAATALDQLQTSEQAAADAAAAATGNLNDEADAASNVSDHATEAESGLQGMAEGFLAIGEALAVTEGLKAFGEEALHAVATIQSVTVGLTALTGSAEQADTIIESIKTLAATQPFAFPEIAPTVQKMVAMGVAAEAIPSVMQTVADTAAATTNSFQAIANMFDRMALSGTVQVRSLATLGLTFQQLGGAMTDFGVTADSTSNEITAAFKAIPDQAARVQVLQDALSKFTGTSIAEAQTIGGQWQIFQNQFEEVMAAVGADLAPVTGDILSFGKTALNATAEVATAFGELPPSLQTGIVVAGLLVAAVVPITLAVGAFGLALVGVNAILPAFSALTVALGFSASGAATSETGAALATASHGAAALIATSEIAGLAAAEGAQALAAKEASAAMVANSEGLAVQTGLFGEETVVAASAAKQMSLFGAATEEAAGGGALLATGLTGIAEVAALLIGAVVVVTTTVSTLGTQGSQTSAQLGILWDRMTEGQHDINGAADATIELGHTIDQVGQSAQQTQSLLSQLGSAEKESAHELLTDPTGIAGAWKDIGDSLSLVTNQFPLMDAAAQKALGTLNTLAAQTARNWADTAIALTTSTAQAGQAEEALVATQAKLQGAVTQTTAEVADLTAKLAAGTAVGNGAISTADLLAAAHVELTAAQKALSSSLGDSTKATKDQIDSWQALTDATAKNNDALAQAQDTYDKITSAWNSGKTSLDGLAINLKTVTDATNNLATAQFKATGITQQWVDSQTNVDAVIQKQADALQKVTNNSAQTAVALALLQSEFQNGIVDPVLRTIPTLNNLAVAFKANEDASSSFNKAVTDDVYSEEQLTGVHKDLVSVMQNGVSVSLGMTDAQNKAIIAADSAAIAIGAQSDAIAGQNNLSGAEADHITSVGEALGLETPAIDTNTDSIKGNTSATQGDSDAQIQLAANLAQSNQAWAAGHIVIQSMTSDMVYFENTAGGASDATRALSDQVKQLADSSGNLGEVTNATADALLAEASAADQAASAVDNLASAQSKVSGKGGAGGSGSGQSLEGWLTSAIGFAQDPATSGFTSITGGDVSKYSQELANLTGQIVTDLQGMFIPMQDDAGILAGTLKLVNGQFVTVAAATTGHTAATVASTTAMTAQTTATAAAATGTTVLAAATTAASTAITSVAAAATSTAGAVMSMIPVALGVTAALAQVATVAASTMDVMAKGAAVVLGVPGMNPAMSSNAGVAGSTGITGYLLGGQYLPANPGLQLGAGYGGGAGSDTGQPVVNLTVNVTGNTVASDQSIQLLATKVGSAVITNLRTTGGLKL